MSTPDGMVTVTEAAGILDRSIEQVRRYLREGKLKGRRIGNQWFVESAAIKVNGRSSRYAEQMALLEEIRQNRDAIFRETGKLFDGAEAVRRSRDERLEELGRRLS